MCEDPYECKFIEIAFGWGPGHIWLQTTLKDPWPHYMTLELGVSGRPLDTFLWALTISWSRFLAHVWSGPQVPSWLLCKRLRKDLGLGVYHEEKERYFHTMGNRKCGRDSNGHMNKSNVQWPQTSSGPWLTAINRYKQCWVKQCLLASPH